jgi:predicted ATPase
MNPGDLQLPEALLCESIALSHEQGSRSWALRSAMDLAQLWCEQQRRADARQLLGQHLEQFTEGFDTLDLRQLEQRWQALAEQA